jgi:thiamine pyrophosphate-dependent acetolactate synthase large subunit-like protein
LREFPHLRLTADLSEVDRDRMGQVRSLLDKWVGDVVAVRLTAGAVRSAWARLRSSRMAIPDDAFVTADMAQVAYTANVAFRCFRPRSYFYPVGLSTLGYAHPAAIGAKLAAPDRVAIALVGDGGFLFTVAELGPAVE